MFLWKDRRPGQDGAAVAELSAHVEQPGGLPALQQQREARAARSMVSPIHTYIPPFLQLACPCRSTCLQSQSHSSWRIVRMMIKVYLGNDV